MADETTEIGKDQGKVTTKHFQLTNTENIVEEAVTVLVNAYTIGQVTCIATEETTIQQANITSIGGPILIMSSFVAMTASADQQIEITLYRDSTPIMQTQNDMYFAYEVISLTVTDTPGEGSYTYYLKVTPQTYNAYATYRSLTLVELKR